MNPYIATIFSRAQRPVAIGFASAALLLTVLWVLGGCRQQSAAVASSDNKSAQSAGTTPNNDIKAAQQVRNAASNDIKFVVPGKDVLAVFTTKSRSLIVHAAVPDLHGAYAWEPGQEPKLLVQGKVLGVTRLSDDSFAASYSDNDDHSFVVTFNGQQLTSQPLVLPESPSGWGGCEGNDEVLVCQGDRPGMKPDQVDGMVFTAILVVDLAERKANWFDVGKDRIAFLHRFDVRHKLIYVSGETFNLKGESLGASDGSHLQATSPSGRFIQSLPEDGGESWQIYELSTKKELFAFNCGKPACKSGDNNNDYWNPAFDGQFVAYRHSGKPYDKDATCDVYQASPPQLLKSFLCDGTPVYDWSRDGKELITVAERGGNYHRERVN